MLRSLFLGSIEQKRRFFNDHIEPLYQRITEIHDDYINGFEEIRERLKTQESVSAETVALAKRRRRRLERLRTLVNKFARQYAKFDRFGLSDEILAETRIFGSVVLRYFVVAGGVTGGASAYSQFIHQLEQEMDGYKAWMSAAMREDPSWWDGVRANPWEQDRAAVVDAILDKVLPNAMGRINESYSKLRLLCL